jgi:hypothetical protein
MTTISPLNQKNFDNTRFETGGEWFPSKVRKTGGLLNTNTGKGRGIKVYDTDQKMSWMDSSIDLSQPNMVKINTINDNRVIPQDNNPYKNPAMRRSCGFVPLHHPYEWSPNKVMNPIRNNPLTRLSESVHGKVTEFSPDKSLYMKKPRFTDPRARASELLQKNAYSNIGKQVNLNLSAINEPTPSMNRHYSNAHGPADRVSIGELRKPVSFHSIMKKKHVNG